MIRAGGELRRAREARGMTLMRATTAARTYGLPIGLSTLSRLEREESPVPLGEFLCLARAVALDAERVLRRQPYDPPVSAAVRTELERLADETHLGTASPDAVAHVLETARDAAAGGDISYAVLLLAILRGPRPAPAPAPASISSPPSPLASVPATVPAPVEVEALSWLSDPRLNLLAGRIALACGDGPLAMDHLRRAAWTLKQPPRPPQVAGPAGAPPWAPAAQRLALRAEILWAEAAVLAGGAASALSALRRILAGRPTGIDGWLACDVAAEASADAADLAEARRYLRRALTRAEPSPDLKLLTWLRAHRIERRFGYEAAAAHAARTALRVLAQEIPAEVGPLHLASILDGPPDARPDTRPEMRAERPEIRPDARRPAARPGARPPGALDLVALRLLSLFD